MVTVAVLCVASLAVSDTAPRVLNVTLAPVISTPVAQVEAL